MLALIAALVIAATPATLPAALVAAVPGDRIVLAAGTYPKVTVRGHVYAPAIIIDARKADVAGLDVQDGGGVVWLGGTLRAPGGMDGFAGNGYAVRLVNAQKVRVYAVTITDAKKGMVIAGGSGLSVQSNRFTGMREDGIIASRASNVTIASNSFTEFRPRATTCTTADVTILALSSRDCLTLGGAWRDGNHADAVQLRDGMVSVRITGNRVYGDMQGIGQMESVGDAPLVRVSITGNEVRTTKFHSITLGACSGCSITGNDVAGLTPGRKTIIRFRPGTLACGNRSADPSFGTEPCQTITGSR